MRITPPAAADAAALAPADAAPEGAPLAPPDAAGVEQAAMIALMLPIDRPSTVARLMNDRREILPFAKDSTRSSSWADARRRIGSNRE